MRKFASFVGLLFIALLFAFSWIIIAWSSGIQGDNTTDKVLKTPEVFSFLIFTDGTTIYAKSGMTGETVYSGDNASFVIQSAIDALSSNGGSILMREGRYYAHITLHDSVSLYGQSSSTILSPDDTNHPCIKMDKCNFSTVSNLKIDGNQNNRAGIHIHSGSHCKIVNTWICNCFDGVYVNGTPHDFLIQGNTINHIQDDGLDVNGMVKSQIIGNNINDCGDNGIDTDGTEYTTFSGNVITNCSGSGLELEQERSNPPLTQYCAVTGNIIYNSGYDGIHMRSGGYNTISGNTIIGSDRYGIYFDNAGGGDAMFNVVVGNLIFNSGSNGIYETRGNADYNFFTGNYLNGNGGDEVVINGLHSQSYNNFLVNDYHNAKVERKSWLYKNR